MKLYSNMFKTFVYLNNTISGINKTPLGKLTIIDSNEYDLLIIVKNNDIYFKLIFECSNNKIKFRYNQVIYDPLTLENLSFKERKKYSSIFIKYVLENKLCKKIKGTKIGFKPTKNAIMLLEQSNIHKIIKNEEVQSMFSTDELINLL